MSNPELPADIALRVRKARAAGASDAEIEAKLRQKYGVGLEAAPFADASGGSSSAAAPSPRAQRMAERRKELGFAEALGFTTATDEQYAKQMAERRAMVHGMTAHLDNVLKGAAGAVTGEGYSAVKARADSADAADRVQYPGTKHWETAGQVASGLLMPGGPIVGGALVNAVPTAVDGGSVLDVAKDAAIGGGFGLAGLAAGKVIMNPTKTARSIGAIAREIPGAPKVARVGRKLKEIWTGETAAQGKAWQGFMKGAPNEAAPVVDDAVAAAVPEPIAAPPPVPAALPPEIAEAAASVAKPKLTLSVAKDGQLAVTLRGMDYDVLARDILRRSKPENIDQWRDWLPAAIKELEGRPEYAAQAAARVASPQKQKSAAFLAKRNAALGLK